MTRLTTLVLSLGVAAGFAPTSSTIVGEVRDSSQAPVPGVLLTLTHNGRQATRTAITNEAGVYAFPSLLPGTYDLRLEKSGFRAITRTGIELDVQQTARADFTLQIGHVSEVVHVTAEAPLLNTEDATVGTVIENRRVVELPLNGRNYLQLVALSTNVSFGFNGSVNGPGNRQGGSRAQQNISIAGQRSVFNRFTLDGAENTDVNFSTYIVLPSIDALEEFKVQTGIYPAEFGRASGQIIASTKSGANQFHGAVFEFLRNDKLDATAYAFTIARPPRDPFRWNQYGFLLSGPVWIPGVFHGRNRLFFSFNFEGYRDRKQVRANHVVPPLALRSGDFSSFRAMLFDPATRTGQPGAMSAQPFPGNVIPSGRIHPVSVKLLEFLPMPTSNAALNFQTGLSQRIDKDQFMQRIDWVENNSSNWFGRYSHGDEFQLSPADPALQISTPLNGTKLLTNVKQALLSNVRVFSPQTIGEFRFGYNQFSNSLAQELSFVRDVVRELNIPGVPLLEPSAWGIPTVNLAGWGVFGNNNNGPFVNHNHIFQWTSSISLTRGRHSLRFGVEIRRDRYNQTGNVQTRGTFAFTPTATVNPAARPGTGDSFADFLLGLPGSAFTALSLAGAQFRATGQYYYMDDQWKLRPDLTLSLGLRYENTPPWFDRSGTMVNVHIPFLDSTPNVADLSRHPTLVRIGEGDFYENTAVRFHSSIKVARDGRLGDRLVAPDNNDLAPRLGIAWRPTDRWTVRTGAGVFYSQDAGNARFDMVRNLAGSRAATTNPDSPDLSFDRPFRDLGPTTLISAPHALGNSHQRRTPYSIQYLFNVQREIKASTLVEGGYLGSVSRKLEVLRQFNAPLPGPGPVSSRQPYPELAHSQVADSAGKANYNSLAVKLQRRQQQGLSYLAGYTWSRSIDDGSAIRAHVGEGNFPQNSYCLRCERGLSTFHAAHRLVTSALYELPFGKGRRFASGGGVRDWLWGGWELGSILILQSGFPFTIRSGLNQSNTQTADTDRPNATGAKVALPRGEQDPDRFFNTGAFVMQPFGTYGNVGRNTVIGPGLISWDFSTLKHFRVREGHQLQFRFEAFNLPNHPNFGTPVWLLANPAFGRIRDTRTAMRELQFGLKYLF